MKTFNKKENINLNKWVERTKALVFSLDEIHDLRIL
jgi:hypothetical protein